MISVFESKACRVWTGTLGTPLDAIENAEEDEIETIPFHVQLWLKVHSETVSIDIQDSAQKGLYLLKSPDTRTHLEQNSTILLPLDAFSCFSMYSPSPFVSTVLLVVDVNDKEQQGYFFSQLQRLKVQSKLAETMQVSNDHDIHAFHNTEAAEDFLVTLHTAFPNVKLTNSARECLAKRDSRRRTAGSGRGEMIKRRKTLSAEAFYGSNTVKPPGSGLSDKRMSDVWRSFYEKLQFRVSHSMMCQLEGTAPIFLSFPRQQEAFEFADQVEAFRHQAMTTHNMLPKSEDVHSDDTPRVFAYESAGDGKRRFLVASLAEFWKYYTKSRADQRHVYEIIREGVPCRLYLDLEFDRAINPHVDGDALVSTLLSLLQLQFYLSIVLQMVLNYLQCFQHRYGIHVRYQDIHQLDSSTPTKFSRHVIFHLPNGDLFASNLHAGTFVRKLINDLVVVNNDKETPDQLYTPFLLNKESQNDSVDKKQIFIDTGVYTRNRMFRVLGSSKFRKQAVLRSLRASSAPSGELEKATFLDSLVCPYPSLEVVEHHQQIRPFRLLEGEPTIGCNQQLTATSTRRLTRSIFESRRSIFPSLDAFIRSQATKGGVQGEIRAIQMFPSSNSDESASLSGEGTQRKQSVEAKKWNSPYPWMIIYHMTRNRWCGNIGRPHKSNNVMFAVDIAQRTFYQKCHDPVCHATNYRYGYLFLLRSL
ncbi:hypothetical protein PsorP6_008931 [Peronosclerospora sorghi]|uniref:Uncharacterized protein n=1 Tax=Peronosclerospora sorghi TaxID=230839 RepID=A0ACC0VY25_9STRA|nr:hypothetical protein PsorP6_008931 [Peronosclerospora sorghi]